MKKLITLILIIAGIFNVNATHLAGGRIWYEYIGDAQNPHRYYVYVEIARDVTGVFMSLPGDICVKSSCFTTTTHTAPLVPYYPPFVKDTLMGSIPGSFAILDRSACVDIQYPSFLSLLKPTFYVRKLIYQEFCSDFIFSYDDAARNSNSNLASSGNFHIEAKLDNTSGPNSSPKFQNELSKNFCVNTPILWSQRANEPDGDSISYSFDYPALGNCTANSPATFRPGFSVQSPIRTTGGIQLNSSTGLLSFTPSQSEIDVIHLVATEYRLNSSNQQYYIVGTSAMDAQIAFSPYCRKENGRWLFDSTISHIEMLCGDSILEINSKRKFLKSTLASDGSDFILVNSKGNLVPISSATTDPSETHDIEASTVLLKLIQPLSYNDTLTLYSRKGNDSNTLINTCANELKANDSLKITTSNCATWIGSDEENLVPFSLYPNPTTGNVNVNLPNGWVFGYITIIDINGKILTRKALRGETNQQVNLGFLPTGLYVIKITSDNWTHSARFQKI